MRFRLPERKIEMSLLVLLASVWLMTAAQAAVATPATTQQPYVIQADSAVFDQAKGTGEYNGHVQLRRGAEQLKANKLTLKLDAKKQLTHVEASGKPVTFADGVDMQGRADRLVYDVKTRTVRLLGNAFVTQGERQFSGAEIIYALDSKRVQAKGGDGHRVRLVLPPSDSLGKPKEGGK